MIPYGRQDVTDADVQEVVQVLRSDFLTQGPAVPAFERGVAAYCGAAHAVAVNSATSGLHLACLALDVGPGDRVWTTPITFVATANAALFCGATIDFVDIDARTYNISVEALDQRLSDADRTGELPRVVIPVHFGGQPCELASLRALADRYGFCLIEDATHAIGARYRNEPIGNGRYSEFTVFSFHPVKIITTAEGGMVLTNDVERAERVARLRSHGVTRDPALMRTAPDGPWYYEQIALGYNYRLTDVQAALGRAQLTRLDEYIERRRYLAQRYGCLLEGLPVVTPFESPEGVSSYHLYVVLLDSSADRGAVFRRMRADGVGVNVHYIPVHLQPYYQALGFNPGCCPEAERYYRRALTLPLHPRLTDADQDFVVAALRRALE